MKSLLLMTLSSERLVAPKDKDDVALVPSIQMEWFGPPLVGLVTLGNLKCDRSFRFNVAFIVMSSWTLFR